MTIIVGDWQTMNKYLPYDNDVRTTSDLPYSFYTGKDADMVCVKHGDNLYYGTNYVNAVNRLHEMAPQILSLVTNDDWVLVDYSEIPHIIVNCTKGVILGKCSVCPMHVNSSQVIVFNAKGQAYKVSNSKATLLYMLSEAILYSSMGDTQLTDFGKRLFIDIYENDGNSLGYLQPIDVERNLKPESQVELLNSQTSDFIRPTRKNIDKGKQTMSAAKNNPGKKKGAIITTVPLDNLTDSTGKFLLSKLLNFLPSVGAEQEVVLDIDVANWGISSASLMPGSKLAFTVWTDDTHSYDDRKRTIAEMLGHSNFTILAVVK